MQTREILARCRFLPGDPTRLDGGKTSNSSKHTTTRKIQPAPPTIFCATNRFCPLDAVCFNVHKASHGKLCCQVLDLGEHTVEVLHPADEVKHHDQPVSLVAARVNRRCRAVVRVVPGAATKPHSSRKLLTQSSPMQSAHNNSKMVTHRVLRRASSRPRSSTIWSTSSYSAPRTVLSSWYIHGWLTVRGGARHCIIACASEAPSTEDFAIVFSMHSRFNLGAHASSVTGVGPKCA